MTGNQFLHTKRKDRNFPTNVSRTNANFKKELRPQELTLKLLGHLLRQSRIGPGVIFDRPGHFLDSILSFVDCFW